MSIRGEQAVNDLAHEELTPAILLGLRSYIRLAQENSCHELCIEVGTAEKLLDMAERAAQADELVAQLTTALRDSGAARRKAEAEAAKLREAAILSDKILMDATKKAIAEGTSASISEVKETLQRAIEGQHE